MLSASMRHRSMAVASVRCALAFGSSAGSLTEGRELIKKVLSSLHTKGEARAYLRHFSKVDSQKFAVLLFEDPLEMHNVQSLATSLAVLQRMGLLPIVIHSGHGWTPTEDTSYKSFTREGALSWRTAADDNARLVQALEFCGGRAAPFPYGAVSVNIDHTGSMVNSWVDLDTVSDAIHAGKTPVLAPTGMRADGRLVRLNPNMTTRLVSTLVQPLKVIMVSNSGGVRTSTGEVVPFVNLADDYVRLLTDPRLTPSSRDRLSGLPALLAALPASSSATLTSADNLIDELFTHDRSRTGTMVRQGPAVRLYRTFEGLDEPRLVALLQDAFGKRLDENYFASVRQKEFWIYLAGDYKGVAVLLREGGVPYMCKLAVSSHAQGQGIADLLWNAITRDHTDMFWRSREDNNANTWYFQHADGSYRAGRWTVFWFGQRARGLLPFYSEFCRDLQPSFHQKLEVRYA